MQLARKQRPLLFAAVFRIMVEAPISVSLVAQSSVFACGRLCGDDEQQNGKDGDRKTGNRVSQDKSQDDCSSGGEQRNRLRSEKKARIPKHKETNWHWDKSDITVGAVLQRLPDLLTCVGIEDRSTIQSGEGKEIF